MSAILPGGIAAGKHWLTSSSPGPTEHFADREDCEASPPKHHRQSQQACQASLASRVRGNSVGNPWGWLTPSPGR